MERFFPGLHQPSDARHFDTAFISVNRLLRRVGPFEVKDWIMDSGAFSHLYRDGCHMPLWRYASEIVRWKTLGRLLAAVAQDLMCEPVILAKTGLSIKDHQAVTIDNYDRLILCETGCYIMPVLQGYEPRDYVAHLSAYGRRLEMGDWVGVGSVCKRNGSPDQIVAVLKAIKTRRPDLRLHGFGLKTTALDDGLIRSMLYSADSMAWSFSARKQGRNANDWREARRFVDRITPKPCYQGDFWELDRQSGF